MACARLGWKYSASMSKVRYHRRDDGWRRRRMTTEDSEERLPYEPALRVIGRHLDAEPTYNMSVLEVSDGFTVRSHPSRFRSENRSVQFTWNRLRDLVVFHTAGRGCTRRRPRHSGIWANFPSGHEDFLRALGHILDHERAGSLSIDEVPEGVAVSYMRSSPDNELVLDKRYLIL